MTPRCAAVTISPPGSATARHAHLLEDLAGDPGRRAVFHLLEVFGARDRTLEPAERIRSHRLHEQRLDVDLQHVLVELPVEIVAAALEDPGDVRELVEADAGAGHRIGEEARRGVLARPVVRPGVAAFDDALVDGIEDFECADDGAVGQHLHLHAAGGHLVDAVAHALQAARNRCWPTARPSGCGCESRSARVRYPLDNTVAAVPAATPFNSERRNMKSPLRNRSESARAFAVHAASGCVRRPARPTATRVTR